MEREKECWFVYCKYNNLKQGCNYDGKCPIIKGMGGYFKHKFQKINKKAYIDPGSGAMIIGSLWQLIVVMFLTVVAFLAKYFWKPIKKQILKFQKKRFV